MNLRRALCLGLWAWAAAAWLCGCGVGLRQDSDGPRGVKAWAVNDMAALTDKTPPCRDSLLYDILWQTITLHAAANETVSFQLVLDAGPAPVKQLAISWDDLTSRDGRKIGKSRITAFRGLPMRVSAYPPWYLRLVDAVPAPAGFYDALVPLDASPGGQPYDLSPGERLAIWFDVSVPRDAAPGSYLGKITVQPRLAEAWSVSLSVQVHNFVLPDARPIPAVGGFDSTEVFAAFVRRDGKPFVPTRMDRSQPLVRDGLVQVRKLMTLAHEHRLDLFDKAIQPVLKRDAAGKVRLDWDDYDAIVMPYIKGTAFDDRVGCPAWPVPFSQAWPAPENYGGPDSDTYATTVGGLLSECRAHFASLEVSDRMFVWPWRLGVSAEAYDRTLHLTRLVRAADTDTPLLSQLPANPPALSGWKVDDRFKSLVDISAPPAQWLDPATEAGMTRESNPLAGLWLSPGLPPYLPSLGVIATPADVRAIPWFAMKYACNVLFLPEVLNWSGNVTSDRASEQARLFYPGTIAGLDGPLPSVRLKRLRRGLQDLAYLWLLQRRGRAEIARTVLDGMVRYGGIQAAGDNYLDPRLDGWVQDPASWVHARRLLAAEVLDAIHPSKATADQSLQQRLAWQNFHEKTQSVRVEQVRSRVAAVTGATGAAELELTVLLDLHNELGQVADVAATIDKLPDGWKAAQGPAHPPALKAGQGAAVELKARGAYVPAAADGKMHFPVSITTNKNRIDRVDASVAFLVAGPAAGPPKIDGLLDDWPMREGNTAGSFKLIGRRGQNGDGLAARQTLAFVLFDSRNLYIAFRCREPNLPGMVARPNNLIRYEQLIACGEDLVEVILDPGADARGSEDLYHLIVKANGVILAERGIHTDPPLGKAVPWSVATWVAIGTQKDAWTVELAIPRSAFGDEGQAEFWGVNFTRYATQGSEASSWSGAPRYFYDPRNLGTMFVPKSALPPAAGTQAP